MKASWIAGFVAGAATLAYCLAAWYLSALWSTLVSDPVAVSRLSVYTIRPLPLSAEYGMLHWQLAATASLLLNLRWGAKRSKDSGENGYALPLICHYGWLLLALSLHISGGLASFVIVQYMIR